MGKAKKKQAEDYSLAEEFGEKPKKKQSASIFSQIKEYISPSVQFTAKKAPITFNVGLSLILFFFYLSIMIVGGPSQPMLFLFTLPTMYILARYIQLERKRSDEQQKSR